MNNFDPEFFDWEADEDKFATQQELLSLNDPDDEWEEEEWDD